MYWKEGDHHIWKPASGSNSTTPYMCDTTHVSPPLQGSVSLAVFKIRGLDEVMSEDQFSFNVLRRNSWTYQIPESKEILEMTCEVWVLHRR